MTEQGYDIDAYRAILARLVSRGYTFATHAEAAALKRARVPYVILRQDVDYSLEVAVQMAAVNTEADVTGTFFVLLRSQIYNLLSHRGLDAVQKIAAFGQRVGLHAHYPADGAEDAGPELEADIDQCSRASGVAFERVVAWHNATPEQLQRPSPLAASQLLCTYDAPFFGIDTYMSDSNMANSVEQFLTLDPDRYPCVQLLFHPINWVLGGQDIHEILRRTFIQVMEEKAGEFRTNRCWQGLGLDGLRVA
jgi:hypothetical protein